MRRGRGRPPPTPTSETSTGEGASPPQKGLCRPHERTGGPGERPEPPEITTHRRREGQRGSRPWAAAPRPIALRLSASDGLSRALSLRGGKRALSFSLPLLMAVANGTAPAASPGAEEEARPAAAPPEGKKKKREELKVVVVGDGGCGKTSLLLVYAKGAFPEEYAPSVFEKYTCSITVGKKEVLLHLYDTAGQEDYDRLRPLSYQNTSVVLVCYDVMNPTSFDNVLIKWSHEVSHFCQGIPVVLVGCKTDLRKDKEHLRKLRSAQQEPITYSQGEEACRQMNADTYLECSAKYRENIEDIFREAASIALNAMKKKRQKKLRPCALL
ncbi:PREDICTED: rho-related GTP-binding protein RhoF [Gekko japonicus]|uniref:Rho-related GTP-binding protein RhoF n=1 Tax=Gekko japonicus TaxID=146911 RepID=A0ABM1KHE7_GEKJA|nr:PREDICTED: rho-related GTP-binding protein RhoF [Gekko japonicus]